MIVRDFSMYISKLDISRRQRISKDIKELNATISKRVCVCARA